MLLHLNIAQARHCNFFGTLVRSLQEKPGGTLLSTQILPIWWSRIIKVGWAPVTLFAKLVARLITLEHKFY
jgi:hypothetical protein